MSRRSRNSPRFYTTYQVASMLGVTAATIANWVRAGHLTAHRTPGGHRRIRDAELLAFAAARGIRLDLSASSLDPSVHGRVLVVDDDVDFGELVASYLEQKHGCLVEVVQSGFEAGLAVARACPAVVLLDLQMPGSDGFAVVSALGADPSFKAVPVVAMSGHLHLLAEARAYPGFAATLHKPVDLLELSALLRALGVALALDEAPDRRGGGVGAARDPG